MRSFWRRLWLVLSVSAGLLMLSAVPAFASNANAGCNQTPYDSTGTGANVGGPYDDTCVPAPSENGNGGGNATGKPCAGCVGKADEKNPPGQQPGGSDANAGYECDTNSGIAKTNPAHTSCVVEEPPPSPPPPVVSGGGGTTPGGSPAKVLGKTLARTGTSTTWLFVVAMMLITAGVSMRVGSVRVSQR